MATRTFPTILLALTSTISFAALTGCGDDTGGSGGAGGEATATTSASGSTSGSPTSSTSGTPSTTGSSGDGGGGTGGGAACSGADTSSCDVVIEPSDDDTATVQGALIDDTDSGDIVCLCPGTYSFDQEISLTVPDVTIRGVGETRDDVVLDFADTEEQDGISVDSDGFTIENLTVKNVVRNGIIVNGAERVTFRNLWVGWDDDDILENNGAYAVYPVGCDQVLVEDTEVVGAADAGIYVGQSTNIIVRNNVVHDSVAGIEIENSSDADVYGNEAYDNTAGILVFVLPNLEKKDGARTKVHDNDIHDNNHENFGLEGTIVASVPPGIGALVLAADTTEIHDNTFTNNVSTSIVLVSFETILALLDDDPEPDPATDPYLSEVYIHDNTFDGNGTEPEQPFSFLGSDPVEDVIWDGLLPPKTAASICLSQDPPPFRNFNGVANIANQDEHETDTTAYECDEPVVDPQEDF